MATETLGRTARTMVDNGKFFRTVLRIDGIACIVGGIATAIESAWLPNIIGAGTTSFYIALGVVFAAWGAWLTRLSTKAVGRRTMLVLIAINALLAIDGLALLLSGWVPLTTVGFWALVVLTDAIAAVTVAYYVGLRRAG